MNAVPEELAQFFRSIDEGEKRYLEKVEVDLHKIHGGELQELINAKQITEIQISAIYAVHFPAMDLRMMGKDPTVAYRRGIRQIFKTFNKNIIDKMETILKLLKDHNVCESSQLKLFVNCVKAFLNDAPVTLDDVTSVINTWCDEIKPEEKIIIMINNNLLV